VAEFRTYFIGTTGWGFHLWVHNAFCYRQGQKSKGEDPTKFYVIDGDTKKVVETIDNEEDAAQEVARRNQAEIVYVHKDDQGIINYIGITDDAARRAREHRMDPEKTGKKMEVITGPLTHDEARTIEAKLIRERLFEFRAKGIITGKEPIQEQLKKAGLLNKNRGREEKRWIEIDPADFRKDTGEQFDIKTPTKR
jgi:predicted GIY-YIG superfamily endonuclease